VVKEIPLRELVDYIDWTPFFQAWELAGHYPEILDDAVVGEQARKLHTDALRMVDRLVQANLTGHAAAKRGGLTGDAPKTLTARAVYGFFPANSVGDDIEIYADESRTHVLGIMHTLRQQMDKSSTPNRALADYIAPRGGARDQVDTIGAFAVSVHGAQTLAADFKQAGDDYNAILVEALADRFAEALAERMHRQAREDVGFGRTESLSNDDLIAEKYRGIRPAPGYPACPDHSEKRTIWRLLNVEEAIGAMLTENCAMSPASSISGWYLFHPQAKYFGVGKIGRDQIEDYARRKGVSVEEAERWLASNLG
jgi:5-methyltetrahydrofolate--homocysteine methyltransferase